jgi:hypothetical protein
MANDARQDRLLRALHSNEAREFTDRKETHWSNAQAEAG